MNDLQVAFLNVADAGSGPACLRHFSVQVISVLSDTIPYARIRWHMKRSPSPIRVLDHGGKNPKFSGSGA